MRSLRHGIVARAVASGTALLVVLGLAGVIFTLHAGSASAGVTATTPPDAVHVVVTHYQGYSTVPDPNASCPTGTTCYTTNMTPTTTTVYDQTFTDAATAQRLQADLNAPSAANATLPGASGRCGLTSLTYDSTFTASGQAVEHVVMRVTCDGFGLRTGYAPNLTLSTERASNGAGLIDVLNTTYSHIPADGGTDLSNVTSQP